MVPTISPPNSLYAPLKAIAKGFIVLFQVVYVYEARQPYSLTFISLIHSPLPQIPPAPHCTYFIFNSKVKAVVLAYSCLAVVSEIDAVSVHFGH
jgi:hypothetical protein